MDDVEQKGDEVELHKVEQDETCPVCGNITLAFQWCPECGTSLSGEGPTKQQAMENAEKLIGAMKAEAIRMIRESYNQAMRKAWYHSHLGSIDFARQIGLITEERRRRLYKEFEREVNRKEEKND